MEITNHKTGDKCVLNFKPCGLFGKELHKVEGYIQDKSKKKLRALYGKWTECLYSVDPATFDAYKKNDKKNIEEKKNSKQVSASEESDEMPMPDSESVLVIPGSILLWRIAPRPPNSAQRYKLVQVPTPGVYPNSCPLNLGDAIQPSHPLLSPSPPTFNLPQHQGLFKWVSSLHQVAKVLEFQLQHQSFQWVFRTHFL